MSTILAFDTSCDETSAAVVKDGRIPLANVISSQIEEHKAFGGVVPELASRRHVENIDFVTERALAEAGTTLPEVDCIAATYGPGLVGALLTGLLYAKTLAYALGKPFIGINHIEGHISSNYLENDFEPPFLCLVVSGGHTNLVHVKDYGVYDALGQTRDDAAGEAFDKIARVLGLAYPGGPHLEQLAAKGNENAIDFPRAYLEDGSFDFSFSGLKSAVINYMHKCGQTGVHVKREDVAASFQKAVTDVLADKTAAALEKTGVKRCALAGGVACNNALRSRISAECDKRGVLFNVPKPVYCTDNAAMVAAAAHFRFLKGETSPLDLNAEPGLRLKAGTIL